MTLGFDLFRLSEERQELRAVIRNLAERQIVPYTADADGSERFPEEALRTLNEAGFNAVHIPEQFDGQGADSVATCIVIEEVARVYGSTSLIPAVNKLGTMNLILGGSDELKSKVLPDTANGKMASYALAEREASSDTGSMKTRAVRKDDEWVLNGSECFITDDGRSIWYTVMAVIGPEEGASSISAFMVHKNDEGFRVGGLKHELDIRGFSTAKLYFENCHIPADRIIGDEGTGFKAAPETLGHTRLAIGAQALGIAQGAYDCTIDYVQECQQFSKPIVASQSIQFMLADMRMKIDAAHLMVYATVANAERSTTEDGACLGLMAVNAEAFASDVAMQVTANAVQLLGGYGFTRDFPVEHMMRDAKITQIYEGTNQICRMIAGHQILTDAQKR